MALQGTNPSSRRLIQETGRTFKGGAHQSLPQAGALVRMSFESKPFWFWLTGSSFKEEGSYGKDGQAGTQPGLRRPKLCAELNLSPSATATGDSWHCLSALELCWSLLCSTSLQTGLASISQTL